MRNIISILDGTYKLETIQKGDICVISYNHKNKIITEYCTVHDVPNHDEIIIKLRLWKTIDLKLVRIKLEYIKFIHKINLLDSYDDIISNNSYQSWELELVINDKNCIIEPNEVYVMKIKYNVCSHTYRINNLNLETSELEVYDTRINKSMIIPIYEIENIYL